MYLSAVGTAAAQLKVPECVAFKKDLYERVLPQLKPDLIVVASTDSLDYPRSFPGSVKVGGKSVTATDGDEFRRQIKADSTRSLQLLEARGAKVLIVQPTPTAPPGDDPFACLTKSKVLQECRFVDDQKSLPLQLIYQSLADRRSTYVANFNQLICPFLPICQADAFDSTIVGAGVTVKE